VSEDNQKVAGETNGKKCPLRAIAYAAGKGKQFFGYDCFEEKCAWWNPYSGCCVTYVIAEALFELTKR